MSATSINKFKPVTDIEEIVGLEKGYERIGRNALDARKYFPGFFTVLIKKP